MKQHRRAFLKATLALGAAIALPVRAQLETWKRAFSIGPAEEGDTLYVNGATFVFSAGRNVWSPIGIRVRDWNTGNLVAQQPCSWIFGSFFQDTDGTIYAYGASPGEANGNAWIASALDSNFAPVGARSTLWQANPQIDRCWNSSVARTEAGLYLAALETAYAGTILQSAPHPLGPWTYIDTIAGSNSFIDWVDGWLYNYFMQWDGISQWRTYVARSQTWWNPGSWQYSYLPVLAPDGPGPEGNDASDYSHAEGPDGIIRGNYLVGDQKTWMQAKTFIFLGTRRQYVQKFFADPSKYHS